MLSENLKDLCDSIKQEKFKSKQACFNFYIDAINNAKKLHTWEEITDFINEQTGSSVTVDTYRYMTKKARSLIRESSKKNNIADVEKSAVRTNTNKGIFSNISEKPKSVGELHNPAADLKKFEDKYK